MKELTDEQIYKIWYQTRGIGTVAFCGNFARAAIAADRALNAEDHDTLEPKRLESIADPTLRAVCETYTNTPGGHFVRLQAVAKLVAAPADRGVSVEEGDSTCQELDGCPTEKAVLQRFWREHQSTGTPVAWLLTDKNINHIQVESVQRLIDRARGAHYTNLIIRVNGKDEHYQADWLKHLTRAIPPSNHSADRDVMRQALLNARDALQMCKNWSDPEEGEEDGSPFPALAVHRAYSELDGLLSAAPTPELGDPAEPRDDSDRTYTKPIGYLPAYELLRLHSGHDAQLRSAKFGPSVLDGDVPVFIEAPTPPAEQNYAGGNPRPLTAEESAIFERNEKFSRLAGRGMHELRNDELAEYVMYLADAYADGPHCEGFYGAARKDLRDAAEFIESELIRKTNDERVLAVKLNALRTPPAEQQLATDDLVTQQKTGAMHRIAAAQQAGQEPVAHAWFHRGMVNFDDGPALKELDAGTGNPIPLYTHPSTSLAALRAKVEALPKGYRRGGDDLIFRSDVLALLKEQK